MITLPNGIVKGLNLLIAVKLLVVVHQLPYVNSFCLMQLVKKWVLSSEEQEKINKAAGDSLIGPNGLHM